MRAGVLDRLGVGWEVLHDRNPSLVYAAIRGFGHPRTANSPYAEWPAFDVIAQAMGGLVSMTGSEASGPLQAGPLIYRSADGHCAIAASTDRHWHTLCRVMDCADLIDDDRLLTMMSRVEFRRVIDPVVADRVAARTTGDVVALLGGRVPVGPAISATPANVYRPPPALDEHGPELRKF